MLDELIQTVALNESAEQSPEAAPFRIAELCEMRDNVVSQVKGLIAFRFPHIHILSTSILNLLHEMAGAGAKKLLSILELNLPKNFLLSLCHAKS